MNTVTTLSAYALGLAVVFAGSVAVGQAVGPIGTAGAPAHGGQHGDAVSPEVTTPAGLPVSQDE